MNLARLLSNAGLFVIEDTRAKHRNFDAPQSIPVSYIDNEDILETVGEAASTYPTPLVVILETGQTIVLTESGKGGVAIQGAEGRMNEAQMQALSTVNEVMLKEFGLTVQGMGKKRSTKKSTPTVEADLSVSESDSGVSDPTSPENSLEAVSGANDGVEA